MALLPPRLSCQQLDEAEEDLEDALPNLGFPLGPTLALAGFFVTLVCGKLLVSEHAIVTPAPLVDGDVSATSDGEDRVHDKGAPQEVTAVVEGESTALLSAPATPLNVPYHTLTSAEHAGGETLSDLLALMCADLMVWALLCFGSCNRPKFMATAGAQSPSYRSM